MKLTFGELQKIVENFAPPDLAIKGDPYGWIFPVNPEGKVKRVAVAVDAREEPQGFDVLITHHRPYKELKVPTFVVHTPLDKIPGGVSETMADLLGLEKVELLTEEGFGHIGTFGEKSFLQTVKESFGVYPTRFFIPKKPKRVAVFPGCGFLFESVIEALFKKGADLLLSGDLTYHTALRLRAKDVGYVDIGHYHSERPGVEKFARRLKGLLKPFGVEVEFVDFGDI
jgi:putative NIF3 family GTP cyclohydrolase 1 type 2